MNKKNTKNRWAVLAAMAAMIVAMALAACGGSNSDASSQKPSSESAQGAGAGLFANLGDDDIKCLEDQGASLPSAPSQGGQAPQGTTGGQGAMPPQGEAPQGAPEGIPGGVEDMQKAFEACDIDLPQPGEGQMPQGGTLPGQGSGEGSGMSDSSGSI